MSANLIEIGSIQLEGAECDDLFESPRWAQCYDEYAGFGTTSQTRQNVQQTEYAFEMACSNIRYGEGVTQEVGMDFKNLGLKNVCVITDKNLRSHTSVQVSLQSLDQSGVKFQVFDNVRVEPTDTSFKEAISFAMSSDFDGFLAVGGGSVIDTCKAANLYASNPSADFLDYVNAPVGKGKPVTHQVKPLIAVATTAGTGSETTGVAIFDHEPLKAKTGIASRALKPVLGIVDPLHTLTVPERVTCYTGFDSLCHALEAFTAVPYYQREPRPENPILRPAYQGSNPISDIWTRHTMKLCKDYLKRAVYGADDLEAKAAMHQASCFAGIGFGNAGVHLCHGMSYPISGLLKWLGKTYTSEGYPNDHPIVPHGLSVVISAPAVFEYTAPACPARHLEAAELLGADISNVKEADAGKLLADTLRWYMCDLGIPDGISVFGYTKDDIPALVKGTLPQHRVIKLSPRPVDEESLTQMFENTLNVY
ncbi:LOW QUALITY PROTEIN: hydroxyacid-oxoacid transhydrogenase, mitochondrial-like [Liolophura sinensis]|uniref:LOW QUALITY PROTEIN: hydroxyacid-oxoacid transhydrogenase, mitochondrial-like n=1 Tax=Liolophura sinensis TaxID=3198878 RepID=UPI003158FDCC